MRTPRLNKSRVKRLARALEFEDPTGSFARPIGQAIAATDPDAPEAVVLAALRMAATSAREYAALNDREAQRFRLQAGRIESELASRRKPHQHLRLISSTEEPA